MINIIQTTASLSGAYADANAQPMVAYRNLLAVGTIASGTSPASAPRLDAVTEDTTEYWLNATVPATLRSTLAASEPADLCYIGGHNLGTAGASLQVQYYDGAAWQTIATITPDDDQPFMVIFPRRSATAWGIQITGAVAQIALAWIGPRLIIPGGVTPDYRPVWASHRVEKYPGVTRRGHFRGQRIERTGASLSASFMPIDHDYALNEMAAFRAHYNEGRAFIWAPAPGPFREDFAYCWAPDGASFAPSIMAGGDLVTLSLTMEAFIAP